MRDDFLNFNEYIEPDIQTNKKDSIIISEMIEYSWSFLLERGRSMIVESLLNVIRSGWT